MIRFRISMESMGLSLMVTFLSVSASADPRFQLMSETWINQAAGGAAGTGTFTAHTYDAAGRPVRTEIFIGKDGSGERLERREYSWFPDGLKEAQRNYQGDDLESSISFRYDARNRLEAKVVFGADGTERFRDTYAYGEGERTASETRWKGETAASMHRYAYADGRLVSDTLLEPEGSAMVAVQAALHGAGRAEGETREARFRKQDGTWYHVQDTYRLLSKDLVLHEAVYAVGGNRMDSAAFAYDADGNRVGEERFTGAGKPLSRLVLAWRDLQGSPVRPGARLSAPRPRLPRLLLSGCDGTGWRHLGSDLMGRGRPLSLSAPVPGAEK